MDGMSLWALLKGLCAGFFYAFISVSGMILISHYVVGKGARQGTLAALGIVVVQGLWAALAILVLVGLIRTAGIDHPIFTILGAAILFVMAVKIYRGRENFDQHDTLSSKGIKAFSEGALMALGLPVRILGYAAIFAALQVGVPSAQVGLLTALGATLGSFLFWMVYTFSIVHKRDRVSPKTLQKFHRYAALILVLFSLAGLLQLYF